MNFKCAYYSMNIGGALHESDKTLKMEGLKSLNIKSSSKKQVFSCCLNFAESATARKSSGRSFHAEGPAWLNERSPNFVRSRGSEKSVVEVERILGRT